MVNATIRTALLGILLLAAPVVTADEAPSSQEPGTGNPDETEQSPPEQENENGPAAASPEPETSAAGEFCILNGLVCFQPPCAGFTPSNDGMNEAPPGGIQAVGPGGGPHDGPVVPGWWYVGLDQGACGSLRP